MKNKQIMTHIVAGYPSIEESINIAKTLIDAGTTYLEIQFPFSDPMADGYLIKEACEAVIKNGFSYKDYFYILDIISSYNKGKIKLICMSYYNPILNFKGSFIEKVKSFGVDYFIIPDLDDDDLYETEKIIPVISTLISENYFKQKKYCSDLVYLISGFGTTGNTKIDIKKLNEYLIATNLDKEIFVGFGINSVALARKIQEMDVGIVIGSYLIELYSTSELHSLEEFMASIT